MKRLRNKSKKWYILTADSLLMGMILALVGGFLDAYTYITRDGVFATAQTGNTVLFAVRAASPEFSGAIQNVWPFLAFVAGVLVAAHMKERLVRNRRVVLVVECIILFVVGLLPVNFPNMIITMTIAFVSSMQIATFNKLGNWSYNSTITTGNLRTAAQAAYGAFFTHNTEDMSKFRSFAFIIFSFISGALIGTFSSTYLGTTAIWIVSGILLLTVFLYVKSHKYITPEVKP